MKSLSDFDYHAIPGDVLLLAGTDKGRWPNLAVQRVLGRSLDAHFTHVALVLSPTLIADATPECGVSVRVWLADEADYDLNRSMVARNTAIAEHNLRSPRTTLDRVQFYINQSYKLWALTRRTPKDQAGMVCSQFVSLVLTDLGASGIFVEPMRALPADVDHSTRGRDGWRQFHLTDYQLCSRSKQPPVGDDYWKCLSSVIQPVALNGEELAQARRLADQGLEAFKSGDTAPLEALLAEMKEETREGAELLEKWSGFAAHLISEQEIVGRVVHEAEHRMLELNDALLSASRNPEILSRIPNVDSSQTAAVLSGKALLDQWRERFVGAVLHPPIYFHDDDAPDRLRRHRAQFGEMIVLLRESAIESNAAAERLLGDLADTVQRLASAKATPTSLIPLYESVAVLDRRGAWLNHESADTIDTRISQYTDIAQQEILPWATGIDIATVRQAFDQLKGLHELDWERRRWLVESRRCLSTVADSIERLLLTSPATTRKPPSL